MIIVNTKGGLGNQMFQYALYITLKEAGRDVKLCTEHYDWAKTEKRNLIQPHGKNFLIEDIFATQSEKASREEVDRLATIGMDFFSRFRRKIGLDKKSHLFEESMGYPSIEELLTLDEVFLDGYWQRFSLFNEAESIIRKEFVFSKELKNKNKELALKIKDENAVSIHVRRNDYLKDSAFVIQDEKYYQEAIKIVCNNLTNPVFYCFSDDQDWCRKNLNFQDKSLIFVDWNTGNDSYIDMQLMSMCKGNIITNSTFSMWAAWLNSNDSKYIIRPKHYYSNIENDKHVFWPDKWIMV